MCIINPVIVSKLYAERHILLFGNKGNSHEYHGVSYKKYPWQNYTFCDEVFRGLLWKLLTSTKKAQLEVSGFKIFLNTAWNKILFSFWQSAFIFCLLISSYLDNKFLGSSTLLNFYPRKPQNTSSGVAHRAVQSPQGCDSVTHPPDRATQVHRCYCSPLLALLSCWNNTLEQAPTTFSRNVCTSSTMWCELSGPVNKKAPNPLEAKSRLEVSPTISCSSLYNAINSRNPAGSQDMFPKWGCIAWALY